MQPSSQSMVVQATCLPLAVPVPPAALPAAAIGAYLPRAHATCPLILICRHQCMLAVAHFTTAYP
jgi:hypothetical protein